MLNHLEFGIDGHTALWLPLGLLAIDRLKQQFQFKWGLALSLAVLMGFLGGYFPLAVYNFGLLGIYSFFRSDFRFGSRFWFFCLFLVLGLGLSAPQFLPGYKLSKKVIREEVLYGEESGETYFLPGENLMMIFAPDFFGHPATWNFFSRIYYSDNASVGSVAFVFCSLSLIFLFFKKLNRARKKEFIFWWLVVLTPTIIMTNNLIGRAVRKIPVAFLSRVTPMRMIWVVAFALATLGSFGFSETIDYFKKGSFKKLKLLVFPLVLIILFWILSFIIPADNSQRAIAQRNLIIPTFISLTTVFGLMISFWRKKLKKLIFVCLVLLSAAELIRQGWKYNVFLERDLVYPQTEITQYLEENNDGYRTIITNAELFPTNSNIAYQVPMIGGYASFRNGRYDYLARLADDVKNEDFKLIAYPRIIYQPRWESPVVNLLGVKYILSLGDIDDPGLFFILREGKTRLYENKDVFPQIFFIEKYWVENNLQEIADRMLVIDLAKEAVLERKIGAVNLGIGKIGEVKKTDNSILFKTSNKENGLVLVSRSYDEGWEAFIDGQRTEVLRADINLMALLIPAGKHKVEFRYLPDGLKLGLAISGFSLLLLVGSGVYLVKNIAGGEYS